MGTFITSDFASTDATAPIMSTIYAADTFTRADGVPGTTERGGYAWTFRAGTWNIKGGVLESGDTTGATPNDCWIDPGKTSGTITAKALASGPAENAAIMFRKASVGNTAWAFYGRGPTTFWTLAKRTGSDSFTVVPLTGTGVYFASGQIAKVVLSGTRIQCYVDGVLTHDVTDSTYSTQTGVGFGTRLATAASPARFDDFKFTS